MRHARARHRVTRTTRASRGVSATTRLAWARVLTARVDAR